MARYIDIRVKFLYSNIYDLAIIHRDHTHWLCTILHVLSTSLGWYPETSIPVVMNDSGNDSCDSQLSLTQRNILLCIFGGVGSLSTVICTVTLIFTCYYKLYKRFAHRLVIYQLLSTLFFSFVCASELIFFNYTSSTTLKVLCDTVGFFLTIAVNSKFFVTFWLTFHLFAFVVFSKDLRRLELLYIFSSFGIPLLFGWIPFVNNLYGIAGAWCWIKNWKGDCAKDKILLGTIEQYLLLYALALLLLFLELLMVIITISVLMYRSYCRSSKAQEENDPLLQRQVEKQKKAFKEILPLILYPIIFIILFLPSVIHRIYGAIVPETEFFLFVLHASTGPSWGLFVGIAVAIHICLLKCCGIQLQLNPQEKPSANFNNEDNPVYTTETIASTNARTYYNVPKESEISLLNCVDTAPE